MMLNQPVNQLHVLPPSFAAHQYGPPAVGYAEVSSAIPNATISTPMHRIGQPQAIPAGPPAFHAKLKFVSGPARTEMIVNEIAKLVKPLHARLSSCLYPRAASCCSSVCVLEGCSGVVSDATGAPPPRISADHKFRGRLVSIGASARPRTRDSCSTVR